MQKPEKLAKWLSMGCLVQVTAGSLTGGFGRGPQRIARDLLDWGWVNIIATDAHNTTSRPPVMSKAFEFLSQNYGAETAQRLCVNNPQAVFEGNGLPEQPEPARAFEEDEEFEAPKKRGLFSVFRRS
jgi:protein-tyrosine phosphatase